jgi:hypothetical protein
MTEAIAASARGAMLGILLVAACTGEVVQDPPSGKGGTRSSTVATNVTVGTTGSGTAIGAGGSGDLTTSSSAGGGGGNGGMPGTGGSRATGGSGGRASGGSTGTAGSGVDGGSSSDVEQLCVDTINMYRATLGLTPYTRWSAEETCADGQAQSDSQTGTAHGAFGKCTENAQNECPGWPTPATTAITGCLQSMWNEGPGSDFNTHGHYINMSSTMYKQVACGFYTTAAGKIWAVQDFK